jgi:nondiscriminating glutamyl-tRNA synthetase
MIADTIRGNMDVIPDCVNMAKPLFEDIGFPEGADERNLLLTDETAKTFEYILAKIDSLNFSKEDIEDFLKELKEVTGIPGKKLYHPLRVALFGSKSGPELWKLFLSLGKEKVKERLSKTLSEINKRLKH